MQYLKFEHCSKPVPFSWLSGFYHFMTISTGSVLTYHLGICHDLKCPTCQSKFRIQASPGVRVGAFFFFLLLMTGPLYFYFAPPFFPRVMAPYLSLAYVAAILPWAMKVILKRSYFKKLSD